MHKAIFLDRDGVLNEDVDHLNDPADLRLLPGVPLALRELRDKGYRLIVITNQGGVAKGILTAATLEAIHERMKSLFAAQGVSVDAIYYCPHHPAGVVKEYAVICECRKPAPGMILAAAKDMEIDLTQSFFVGDKTSDIEAGKRAGVRTILVRTGYGGRDALHDSVPDFTAADLLGALPYIQ